MHTNGKRRANRLPSAGFTFLRFFSDKHANSRIFPRFPVLAHVCALQACVFNDATRANKLCIARRRFSASRRVPDKSSSIGTEPRVCRPLKKYLLRFPPGRHRRNYPHRSLRLFINVINATRRIRLAFPSHSSSSIRESSRAARSCHVRRP